jgi:hypothetical protein
MKVATAARNSIAREVSRRDRRNRCFNHPEGCRSLRLSNCVPTRSSEVRGTNLGRSIPFAGISKRPANRSKAGGLRSFDRHPRQMFLLLWRSGLTICLRMARNRTSSRWAAIAFVVTLVLFFVSSVSSAHSHDGVSGRGCDLCHTAKLPALCLPVGPTVVLPAQAEWHFPLVVFLRTLESDRVSGPSRAPPLS